MLHFEETGGRVEMAGRVADFCPICRDLRPFTVRTRTIVRENVVVMFAFPFFEDLDSTEDGVDCVCEVCNLDLSANPLRYEAVLDRPDLGLEELIERTHPELRKTAADRLAIEARIRSGTLDPDERRQLLLEPFRMLDHRLRAAKGTGPGRPLTIALAAVPLCIAGGIASRMFPARAMEIVGTTCLVLLVGTVLLLIGLGFRHLNARSRVSRVRRLEVYPLLGRALKPLKPSRPELDGVLATLRDEDAVSGTLLDPDRILAETGSVRP